MQIHNSELCTKKTLVENWLFWLFLCTETGCTQTKHCPIESMLIVRRNKFAGEFIVQVTFNRSILDGWYNFHPVQ